MEKNKNKNREAAAGRVHRGKNKNKMKKGSPAVEHVIKVIRVPSPPPPPLRLSNALDLQPDVTTQMRQPDVTTQQTMQTYTTTQPAVSAQPAWLVEYKMHLQAFADHMHTHATLHAHLSHFCCDLHAQQKKREFDTAKTLMPAYAPMTELSSILYGKCDGDAANADPLSPRYIPEMESLSPGMLCWE